MAARFLFRTREKRERWLCTFLARQARTGHQRGMGGRWTDDDDTHERHTDTNRLLTRHTVCNCITRSAEPTLGDPCLLYGPFPANAHPRG